MSDVVTNQDPTQVPPAQPDAAQQPETQAQPPVEQVSVPALPGKQSVEAELAWFKENYAKLADQSQSLASKLQQYELAQLPEDERHEALLRQREEALAAKEQELQAQATQAQVAQAWNNYLQAWVAPQEQAKVLVPGDPVKSLHNIILHHKTRADVMEKELAALKQATVKPTQPTTVTATNGNGPAKKSIYDVSLKDLAAMRERAMRGEGLQTDQYLFD